MKHIALTLCGLCIALAMSAQTLCGTPAPSEPDPRSYDKQQYLRGMNHKSQKRVRKAVEGSYARFRVQLYLVRDPNSAEPLYVDFVRSAIDRLNTQFSGARIEFAMEDQIEEIEDGALTYFVVFPDNERRLMQFKREGRLIHVFLVNKIQHNDTEIGGYTYLPTQLDTQDVRRDMIVMTRNTVVDPSSLAHEMGHFFGLYHTHENFNNSRRELVSGKHCLVLGDCICDTPADPNVKGWMKGNDCTYNGEHRDPETGERYNPPVNNIMSYAEPGCRFEFTAGQHDRIKQYAHLERAYLMSKTRAKGSVLQQIDDINLAFAHYQQSQGGPKQYIVLLHHDSCKWSNQMLLEMASRVHWDRPDHYSNIIEAPNGARYTLVLYNASTPNELIPDFFGNEIYPQPGGVIQKIVEFEFLLTFLRQQIMHYPALIFFKYDPLDKKAGLIQRIVRGYQKPYEVDDMLNFFSPPPAVIKNVPSK